jgi:hypothetical protein
LAYFKGRVITCGGNGAAVTPARALRLTTNGRLRDTVHNCKALDHEIADGEGVDLAAAHVQPTHNHPANDHTAKNKAA